MLNRKKKGSNADMMLPEILKSAAMTGTGWMCEKGGRERRKTAGSQPDERQYRVLAISEGRKLKKERRRSR